MIFSNVFNSALKDYENHLKELNKKIQNIKITIFYERKEEKQKKESSKN